MPEDYSDVRKGHSSTGPASASAPRSYTVKKGDSLSKIAREFYGDVQHWTRIYEANRNQIQNPDLIQPGWTLVIP